MLKTRISSNGNFPRLGGVLFRGPLTKDYSIFGVYIRVTPIFCETYHYARILHYHRGFPKPGGTSKGVCRGDIGIYRGSGFPKSGLPLEPYPTTLKY